MPERERSENSPERNRRRFPGISSRAYEHPADRTALVALRKIDGFDILLRKLSGFIDERKIRLSLLADGVKVGDLQSRGSRRCSRTRSTCWTSASCRSCTWCRTRSPTPSRSAWTGRRSCCPPACTS
ncbi:hypothetical protein ACFQ9X_08265 [Catenulispora yoronensis]